MEFPEHLAPYNRYLWSPWNLIVVTGEAEKLWRGREEYAARHSITRDAAEPAALVSRLLAAAGLAAVSLAEREFWGWSVSLPGRGDGLFCGAEPEGMLCGRWLAASTRAGGLCVVQRQAEKLPLAQSHVTIITQDPVEAVERYFEVAEQTLIRIAVDGGGRCALLRPLPGGVFDAVNGLSDAALIETVFSSAGSGRMKLLEEVVLFYGCPCSREKIEAMVRALPADQQHELWGDLARLEITCPRCGRLHTFSRRDEQCGG